MSIWLSLIPQLQKTGQNSIYPSHNSLILDGPSWGIVRNASRSNMMANIDNKVKGGLAPPSTTCMTLSDSAQVSHCIFILFLRRNDSYTKIKSVPRVKFQKTTILGAQLLIKKACRKYIRDQQFGVGAIFKKLCEIFDSKKKKMRF